MGHTRMTKEVNITIFNKSNIWRYEIEFENYRMAGQGSSLEDAELKAHKALASLPKHDMVHTHYPTGKHVEPAKGKMTYLKEVKDI